MITSRNLSTISYNSVEFLNSVIMDLYKRRVISFASYIYHYPEEDEKKSHFHLFIIPNGRIDTDVLKEHFIEVDENNEIPLKCLPFRYSKFSEWYLYSIHDKGYLYSKGQSRKYFYTLSDVVATDCDYLLDMIHQIDFAKFNRLYDFINAVEKGSQLEDLIRDGLIPPQQFLQFKSMYNYLTPHTDRGDRGEWHG